MEEESSSNKLNSILLQDLFQTFHGLKKIFLTISNILQSSASNLQNFFSIIRTYFLAVGQNNFRNKIPIPCYSTQSYEIPTQ